MPAYTNLIADDQRLVVYRPRLNALTGSATGSIFFSQVLYWFRKNGNKPFYKFNAPCDHPLYRPGDSWGDELGYSWAEISTARKRVAAKIDARMTEDQRLDIRNQHMIVYWMTRDRLTFYDVNPFLVDIAVGAVYSLPAPIYGKDKQLFKDCLNTLFRDCLNSNFRDRGIEILIKECLNRYTEKKNPEMDQQKTLNPTIQKTTRPPTLPPTPATVDQPDCPHEYGYGLDVDVGFYNGMIKTPGDLWQTVKDESSQQIDKALASTWLQPSFAWAYGDGRLFVGIGNDKGIEQLTNDRGLGVVIGRNVDILTKDRPVEIVYIVARKPQKDRQPTAPAQQAGGNGAARHMQY